MKAAFAQGLLVAVVASGFYWLAPPSEKDGAWANIVLRNWNEYGLLNLQGKMIWNSGGNEVISNPKLYGGHQPWVLYMAYLVQLPTRSPGDHGLFFFVLFCLAVWASVRYLFCGWSWGPKVAFLAAVSPGLLRSPLQLDTLAIPVPLGLAIFSLINRLCAKTEKVALNLFASVAILSAYTFINWTTVFALGPMVAAWFVVYVLRLHRPKLWFFLATISTVSLFVVSGLALSGKSGQTEGLGEAASRFFNTYLFGAGGYGGVPVNWSGAARRIIVANAIGLLPLLLGIGWAWRRIPNQSGTDTFSNFLPFGVAILSIAGMRNYFAAHPWMAGSVFAVGLATALWLRADKSRETSRPLPHSAPSRQSFFLWQFLFFPAAAAYCLLIAGLLRLNSAASDSFMRWLKNSTSRSDIIFYSPTTDPWIDAHKDTISGNSDRALREYVAIPAPGKPVTVVDKGFYLTSTPMQPAEKNQWLEVRMMQSQPPAGFLGIYRRHISKRDSREVFNIPSKVYLYQHKTH